uniref:RRM domain-containing protein n=1 Tax=Ditylenchus dipsaci TaxID=166011 RepID=A0A915CZ14_9BILA
MNLHLYTFLFSQLSTSAPLIVKVPKLIGARRAWLGTASSKSFRRIVSDLFATRNGGVLRQTFAAVLGKVTQQGNKEKAVSTASDAKSVRPVDPLQIVVAGLPKSATKEQLHVIFPNAKSINVLTKFKAENQRSSSGCLLCSSLSPQREIKEAEDGTPKKTEDKKATTPSAAKQQKQQPQKKQVEQESDETMMMTTTMKTWTTTLILYLRKKA